MQLRIKIPHMSLKEALCGFFMFFCFIPFLFPNPIVTTNIQPYAALLGTFIFLLYAKHVFATVTGRNISLILGCTFAVSFITMIIGGVSIESVRGVYNYFALFIIPCAIIASLETLDSFPEKLCKFMMLVWFAISTIQFFVYRGFMTQLISGVRWSLQYRGVVGLASEPSFLGIACFYFLHIIQKFKTKRLLYSCLVLIMGVLYAQSTMGILFILGYFAVFLLDKIHSKKGVYIWFASIIAIVAFWYYLNTKLIDSRLYRIVDAFMNGGVDSVLSDGSASIRINSIGNALQIASDNLMLPNGFGSRIGSAYGGLLVELGFFAIPAIILISFSMSLTFEKRISRIAYFVVVTFLLLNNTQIGNPLLLMIVGMNIQEQIMKNKVPKQVESNDAKVFT